MNERFQFHPPPSPNWMPIRDTESDFRPLFMFDDENWAKVRRPIGAIDHDGWTYITYGPHDDWGPHPVQNPNGHMD